MRQDRGSTQQNGTVNTNWPGFKIVGDNIDRNYHPSFQRHSNSTNSMHAFHMYAVQDLSSYSDIAPSSIIEIDKLLISKEDTKSFLGDAVVLLSRYAIVYCNVCGC